MLSLCVATLDLDGITLPKNSQRAMKYGRNTSRHYQTDTFADYDDLRIIVGNAIASGRYSIGLGDDTDARTFEVEEPSGDVLEDLTYDYDAEAFVQETSINRKIYINLQQLEALMRLQQLSQ
ncbi:hypothetical protein Syun_010109 [Stephania yunnanensis]|uniref:Uncharacterized protein n=1 Tax=Stephania yunnanensis TaxID=152371 RepID=A0AAP0KIH8_9MAGN